MTTEHKDISINILPEIFNTTPFTVVLSRLPDGQIVDVNQTWVDLSGFSREEMIGHTTAELNINPDTKQREATLAELKKDGHVRNREISLRMKSGQMRTMLVNIDIIKLDGQSFILNTSQDITAERAAKDALQAKVKELEEMVNIMVGRELEMVKLKAEVEELQKKLGQTGHTS